MEAQFFKSCCANSSSHELERYGGACRRNLPGEKPFHELPSERRTQEQPHCLWPSSWNRKQPAAFSRRAPHLRYILLAAVPPKRGFGVRYQQGKMRVSSEIACAVCLGQAFWRCQCLNIGSSALFNCEANQPCCSQWLSSHVIRFRRLHELCRYLRAVIY